MHQSRKTLRQAATELLKELGPTHYRQLTDEILSRSLATSSAEKPENVLNRIMSTDISHNGTLCRAVVGLGFHHWLHGIVMQGREKLLERPIKIRVLAKISPNTISKEARD